MSPAGTHQMRRMVAVLVMPSTAAAAPAVVDPAEFGRALVEDSCDLVADLELVTAAVAVSAGAEQELGGLSVEELAWPGTPVLRLSPSGRAGPAAQTLRHLTELGARQGAVLAADAPDTPPLLIGKLFRALGETARGADVAACPAENGGLVALAARLPLAGWAAAAVAGMAEHLPPAAAELDLADVIERLHRAAPRRRALAIAPGWHRLRSPADLSRLDPGLEGWPATRGVLRPTTAP